MSTKIYTGFFLDTPIDAALPILKDIKATLEPAMKTRAEDAMCERLATLFLKVLAGKSTEPTLPLSCSQKKKDYLAKLLWGKENALTWAAQLVNIWASVSENPDTPPEDYAEDCCVLGKVVLYPHEKKTYGIAFGADDFCQLFLKQPHVHKFCYWNNSDKLPGLSDEEWETRGNIWHDLISSFWAEDDGLTYTLFTAKRFLFDAPEVKNVDAWLTQNRARLIFRRADTLLREKLSESIPQQDLSDIDYFLKLHGLAMKEIQDKTNLSTWAIARATEEVPFTYDGILTLLD